MIDLLATTLGFQAKHAYSVAQLKAVCSISQTLLRNKGNIRAIDLLGRALLNSEGVRDSFYYEAAATTVRLFIPSGLSDLNLLKDLLPYVMPAGMSVEVMRSVHFDALISNISVERSKVTVHVVDAKGNSKIWDGDGFGQIVMSILTPQGENETAEQTVVYTDYNDRAQ